MSTYIISGNYTASAIVGMIAKPSDRAAAVLPLVESAGGKLISYYLTTGETDFLMVAETDDIEGLAAALMVAGASGTVSNLKTVQAFSSEEFTAMQRRAGKIAASFSPAG